MPPDDNSTTRPASPSPISFGTAFLYWLKLGFISFGGPAGQISLMHQELVFIGISMDEVGVRAQLDACLLSDAEMALGAQGWRKLPDPFPVWRMVDEEPATETEVHA